MNHGIPISSVLVKPVSADCNLACEYCFYSSKAKLYPETKRHQMSNRVLRELVAQLLTLSVEQASFCWQGGEPTLAGLDFYREIMKYQSLFKLPGQAVENSLQTNGILIGKDWAEFLSRYRFLVGVSLDGPQEFHDYYRRDYAGRPSYKKVMRGIEWLQRYNVDFNILTLLNSRNIEHPRELYGFFLNQGFQYLQFIPCLERDPERKRPTDFSITPEQYGRFLCAVFDEWISSEIPKVYVRDFDEILIDYVTGESPNCTFGRECGNYVVVEFNGDVYPCDFHVEPQWFLGNLTEQPLEEIVGSEKFSGFRSRKAKMALRCGSCSWVKYCRGGCPRHQALLGLEHNYFCLSYRTFFKHSHQGFLRLREIVEHRRRLEMENH